jgi:hypothetical protein
MKAAALERFLARLYTDAKLRRDFLARPEAVALAAGLDPEGAADLARIDRDGLELAAESYRRKREWRS